MVRRKAFRKSEKLLLSSNCSAKKRFMKIAQLEHTMDILTQERLDLVFHKDDFKERALALRNRLKKEAKFLIILDDVWKKLDLPDIGIAFEDRQKGCKILLISRSQDVLRDEMDVKNNFEVALLSESEAWTCFRNIVGDDSLSNHNSDEFNRLATQIVKECACLPLAIVTVAGALKNKGLHFWKDALRQLESSDINEKVYSSVKLSYDFLKNEENGKKGGEQLQKIFLFCSLREEDANIFIQELLNLVTGWGLFQNVYTLQATRNRLQTLLDKLKAHGLLMNGTDGDSVKMHDVIRDVGILIASADPNNMYNIRSNDELKEYLDNDKLKDAVAISLELHLCFATLGDIDSIGELKKLKVLDLEESTLVRLGEQIGNLSFLQVLNLRKCWKLKVIPPNVISRLLNLEELNMERSFKNWKVEGVVNGNENNASLSEIKNLGKLTAFFLEIPEANMLPQDLFSIELKRFKITLGTEETTDEGSRILELIKFNISRLLIENGFKMLLKRLGKEEHGTAGRSYHNVVRRRLGSDIRAGQRPGRDGSEQFPLPRMWTARVSSPHLNGQGNLTICGGAKFGINSLALEEGP
ncbi:hypothetical protein FNV43_RR02565 [Rhamnella rubrinervis]|uniref:NB-ARC domain-containing protein n=1 Tax=Rhamnella rubrinervis TaxID=2594499 RepID=A0A8K0HTP2_9ROSA|nr:hypothetical protein FNV43_RR02565 [Rhamnella rubrinervis]